MPKKPKNTFETNRAIDKAMAKIRVAIYARFSSDMQREESIDAQVRACREFAEREGYEVVAIYTDEAISAKNDNRDDFQRMIHDALNKDEFDIILVHKFNRFARNKFDSVLYKKRLRDIGKNVVSVTQKIDDSPEGKMLEGILESMDEYYSANLALEVMKGMRENALKGKSTGGRTPLGYSYNEQGILTPNDKAFLVRKIFDMYIDGYGKLMIANELNDMGYRSQTGKEFRARTISDILKNEKYIGHYIYNLGNETIRLNDFHTPIIDKATWEKAREVSLKRHKPRMNSTVLYTLTGKMFCGCCNERYSGGGNKRANRSTGKLNYYYICNGKRDKKCKNKSVNKEKLEAYICEHILDEILNDQRIEEIGNEFDRLAEEYEKNKDEDMSLESLKKELDEVHEQKSRLMDLYLLSKNISATELDERMAKLNANADKLNKQIKIMESKNNESLISKETAVKYLQDFKVSFDMDNKQIVKSLFDTFVEKVIIHESEISITYKVDFTALERQKKAREVNTGLGSTKEGANTGIASPNLSIAPLYFNETITRKDLKRYIPHIVTIK